jgi:hypothetical protein
MPFGSPSSAQESCAGDAYIASDLRLAQPRGLELLVRKWVRESVLGRER